MVNLQPLHVGFTSDKGANLINVHWYTKKQNLHHVSLILMFVHYCCMTYFTIYSTHQFYATQVWDANIIETAEERFYDSDINSFTKAIQENITVFYAVAFCYPNLCNCFSKFDAYFKFSETENMV